MKRPKQNPRILKVEIAGDRYQNQVVLQVRLRGKWLCDAGLKAEQHVLVFNPREGILVLRVIN